MRSIAEIKQVLCDEFMANEMLATAYGFALGSNFSERFGRLSIEGLLLYIAAVGIYTVEALQQQHKAEVDALIEAKQPHRAKWYRDKALAFVKDLTLIPDTDRYDTSGMTEEEVEAARVVRYAAASESPDASLLTIKVAGERGGELRPLDAETETQLKAYLMEVKDAGVRIALVNQEADTFDCSIDIYYDAMLAAADVREAVETAIKGYVGGLPFNGEYTNMGLVDAVQRVTGVKVAELTDSRVQVSGEVTVTAINARHRPAAGHMRAGALNINTIPYDEQV